VQHGRALNHGGQAVRKVGVHVRTSGPWALVQQEVEAGILVAPFGFLEDGTGYHLLRPIRTVTDGRVEALIAWLQTSA